MRYACQALAGFAPKTCTAKTPKPKRARSAKRPKIFREGIAV
jgi:hypothetical protein